MPTRQNILITGASSGLGKGMAREFARRGRNLALCARRVENLESLKSELEASYPDIRIFIRPLDVNDAEAVFETFNAFQRDFAGLGGTLDRVIVNAGIGKGGSLGRGHFADNQLTAKTNFLAAITQFEAAIELFRAQNHGHLVAVSSMSAFRGYRGVLNVYAATKAALASLAEGARVDLLKTPIRVTTLFPGYIRTEMNEDVKGLPFIIGLEEGAQRLVRAIEKEKNTAYVPFWPWYFVRKVLPFFSLKMLRKF